MTTSLLSVLAFHNVQYIYNIFFLLLFIISYFLFQDLAAGKMFSEEAAQIYDRATTTFLKTNMLLHFAYSDFEEVTLITFMCHFIYFMIYANKLYVLDSWSCTEKIIYLSVIYQIIIIYSTVLLGYQIITWWKLEFLLMFLIYMIQSILSIKKFYYMSSNYMYTFGSRVEWNMIKCTKFIINLSKIQILIQH